MQITDFIYESDWDPIRKKNSVGKLFIMRVDFWVSFKLDGTQHHIIVKAGFKTDLASVPKIVPRMVAENLDSIEGATVHDWLCVNRPEWSTSDIAADIFLAAMEASKIGRWKRNYMAWATRRWGPKW